MRTYHFITGLLVGLFLAPFLAMEYLSFLTWLSKWHYDIYFLLTH